METAMDSQTGPRVERVEGYPGDLRSYPWAAQYLASAPPTVARIAGRTGAGLGLSALYGLSMGLSGEAPEAAQFVLAVVSLPLAVLGLVLPALFIVLAFFNTALTPLTMADHGSHAVFRLGLLLAGVAPAMALYATTTAPETTFVLGLIVLYFSGFSGLWTLGARLCSELGAPDGADGSGGALGAGRVLSLAAFGLFAMVLVLRLSQNFPYLGGVS